MVSYWINIDYEKVGRQTYHKLILHVCDDNTNDIIWRVWFQNEFTGKCIRKILDFGS
jgi:hypothetical protein